MAYGQLARVVQLLRRTVGPDPATAAATDRQLLERFAQQRDEPAFANLVERHGPMVLAVCRRVQGDTHAAEDAFQATFLVLAQKAAALRWQESVGGWLHEVAFRVAHKARVEALRRRAHERQVPDVSTVNPIAEAARRELRAVLDEELARLPEKYRAPLVLCYLEGKTNEEAAQQLGWTKGTVSGQLARARDLLRVRLGRRGVALPAAACGAALAECAAAAAVPPILMTSTIKAAVLGTAAEAAAAGAVAAPVAALAEGVMQTMFVTKLKMAALILIVLGLAGAGAGWFGYRTLAAGKDAAALAPLPEKARPVNAEPRASEPVEKDGLQISVKPHQAVFGPKEPLRFVQKLSNVSDRTLFFYEFFSRRPTESIRIEEARTGAVWQWVDCSGLPLPPAPQPAYFLASGASYDLPAACKDEGQRAFRFIKMGAARDLQTGLEQLPPGKYRVTSRFGWAKINLPDGYQFRDLSTGKQARKQDLKQPAQWSGELLSKPAEFEIVAQSALSDTAKERPKAFKDSIDKFRLQLTRFGGRDKLFYFLSLHVSDLRGEAVPANLLGQQLDKAQAEKLIDHLAAKGFLDHGVNIHNNKKFKYPDPDRPAYGLKLSGPNDLVMFQDLGWNDEVLKNLENLRGGLDAEAAKSLDRIIQCLQNEQKGNVSKVAMYRRGPNAGKVFSLFLLDKDGAFRSDGPVVGQLPSEAIDALIDQLDKADKGPEAEDAGTVSVTWLDRNGKQKSILFTHPQQAADCQKLLATLAELAKKHAAK